MSIVTDSASVSSAKVSQKVAPAGRVLSDFGQYMKERGLKAADLAPAFDVSVPYVYSWARGACKPGWKVARRIEAWTTERFGLEKAFVVGRWT